jgi:hypothetical protein
MADQETSAPGGAPGGNVSANTGGSNFMRDRTAQLATSMQQQPAPGEQAPAEAAQQAPRQQQAPAAEQKIRVGDAEYTAADLQTAIAERAVAQSRKATLPATPNDFQVKLPDGFELPAGVKFEFDAKSPELAQARKIAHARGMDQETFSDMLGAYAASKIGEAQRNAQLRDINMQQLGTAGPQRVEAVATFLQARAGNEGRQTADFLRQFPSAPIVKTMENLMKAFSSQGGADFSQSHRAQEEEAGTIPGYSSMSFVAKRAWQMQQMLSRPGGYRGGGRRGE